jgi:hypothetical protein
VAGGKQRPVDDRELLGELVTYDHAGLQSQDAAILLRLVPATPSLGRRGHDHLRGFDVWQLDPRGCRCCRAHTRIVSPAYESGTVGGESDWDPL